MELYWQLGKKQILDKTLRPPFMDQKLRLVLSEAHVQGIRMTFCVNQGNKADAGWYRKRLRMYVERIGKGVTLTLGLFKT